MPKVNLKNLELRHQTYFAKLRVPEDCIDALGRSVFIRTTGQHDPVAAAMKARPMLADWRHQIEQARSGFQDNARDSIERMGLPPAAKRIMLEQQGIPMVSFTSYLEPWKKALAAGGMKARQVDQYAADVNLYADRSNDLAMEAVTAVRTRQWAEDRQAAGDSLKTVQRRLAGLRNYWGFLQDRRHVDRDLPSPFIIARLRDKAPPTAKVDKRTAFKAEEVVSLWRAAKPGSTLADLIVLAAFTGGRIEELFRLRMADVALDDKHVPTSLHLDSKTDAGDRVVPVVADPVLLGVLKRLMGEASGRGGYIVPSNAKNQYGERSQAMGQRFGRFKTAQGFGPGLVFHSFRKTVATLLHGCGCPEPIAADILGHKITTMSYGVYSSGSTVAVRREWLEKAAAAYKFA